MKNLIIIISIICVKTIALAQPQSQNLSAIDPRLVNGFTMTKMLLTAKVFKGTIPAGSPGTSAIKTYIGLQKLQAVEVKGDKSKYFFKIIPYFSFNSWLSDSVKKEPETMARVLNHEQNHYNVHLLMADELKKELSATWFDSKNYGPGILAIRDKYLRQESKINQLYEIETSYGQDINAQKQWDERIATKGWQELSVYVNGKM